MARSESLAMTDFLSEEFSKALLKRLRRHEGSEEEQGQLPSGREKDLVERALYFIRVYSAKSYLLDSATEDQLRKIAAAQKYLVDIFLKAVTEGDVGAIKKIAAKLARIEQHAVKRDFGGKRKLPPWEFLVGAAVITFLKKNTVPTKKQVEERTIKMRDDHAKRLGLVVESQRDAESANFRRIYRALGLSGLPEAPTHPVVDKRKT
jgi:hypothetical protein